MTIPLTPEELALAKPVVDQLDGLARGFATGIEQAKQVFIRELLKQRKPEIPPQE